MLFNTLFATQKRNQKNKTSHQKNQASDQAGDTATLDTGDDIQQGTEDKQPPAPQLKFGFRLSP